MDDLENIEGFETAKDYESISGLTDSYRDYIEEVLPTQNQELIVARIDELSTSQPPQAIDSNPEVAALLGDSVESFDSKYLEAPNDIEQAEQISDAMLEIEGTDYTEWQRLSPQQRVEMLQKVENAAAKIAHRESCPIIVKSLGENHFGYYSPETKTITLNSDYLKGDGESYKMSLDTVIHEGRHAYQDYNLHERQVHSSPGDLTNWYLNHYKYGYQDVQTFGFCRYWMQPVEADARKFAEDVTTKFFDKV